MQRARRCTVVHPVLITDGATQLGIVQHTTRRHQVLEHLACVNVRRRPVQPRLVEVRLLRVVEVKVCSMRQYHLQYIVNSQRRRV